MRAIGLSLVILLVGGSALRADTHAEVVDLFASMTAALTEDPPNAPEFMKAFDRRLPEYDQLSRAITALVLNSHVASSVDFVNDEGDGSKRTVDLDWYFELRSLQPDGPTRRRRQIVQCQLAKQGKRWRIVSIKPLSFFQP